MPGSRRRRRYAVSLFFEEVWSLFDRLRFFPHPIRFLRPTQPVPPTVALNETSGPFLAKDHFTLGADVIVIGNHIYRWRGENTYPAFIALRPIESGEEVVSNPSDLEQSDLMVHWSLTHSRREQQAKAH